MGRFPKPTPIVAAGWACQVLGGKTMPCAGCLFWDTESLYFAENLGMNWGDSGFYVYSEGFESGLIQLLPI
jgi:hypothetical protein